MSSKDQNAIQNAEQVIERFGGIRPMATKMGAPVTTVQGWKKRNVIPGTRREEVLAAAQAHNVNLSDLVQNNIQNTGGPANQNGGSAASKPPASTSSQSVPSVSGMRGGYDDETLERQIAVAEKKAIKTSTVITIILLALVIGGVVALFWPQTKHTEQRINMLEGEVETIQEGQSFLRGLIPDNIEEKFSSLQHQAESAQEKINAAMDRAQKISSDVLAENAGTIDDRIIKLEGHIEELGGSPRMAALLDRVQTWQLSPGGQSQLSQAMQQLSALTAGFSDKPTEDVNAQLEAARGESPVISQTLQGVPNQDLKAAVMLLGLAQFRNSLNRSNQPFEEDLALLMNMVGDENPQLKDALVRLAPQADQGVLTPEGLSSEFKTMAGDIVVASLKGEDVSIQEKAKARMNEVFAVEKDGELISGTPTQATVARTQKLLDEGKLEDAIAQIQALDGPAAAAAQPWLDQARMTLLAEKAKQMVSQSINLRAYGGKGITAGGLGSGFGDGSKLIQNEEGGINVLKRNPMIGPPKIEYH